MLGTCCGDSMCFCTVSSAFDDTRPALTWFLVWVHGFDDANMRLMVCVYASAGGC